GREGGGPGVHIMHSWDYWNEYYKHYDFKEGLDPKGSLVRLGGKFENPAPKKQYAGDYVAFPGGRPVRALYAYQQAVALNRKSMTGQYAARRPQDYAEMNPGDAERLGVKTGDWVKARSPSSKHLPLYANSLGDGWY